jgi:hypothetical protein
MISFFISVLGEIDEKAVEKVKSIRELFSLLCENKLFTQSDVIFIQSLLKQIDCGDLYKKCIKYARKNGALCFYEKQPGAFLHKL